MARRRSDCNTRLRLVVRLCSCSPAKEAEYFTTHRYSRPWTRVFSAAARTPGWALLQAGNSSPPRLRNPPPGLYHGQAQNHPPTPLSPAPLFPPPAQPSTLTTLTPLPRNL